MSQNLLLGALLSGGSNPNQMAQTFLKKQQAAFANTFKAISSASNRRMFNLPSVKKQQQQYGPGQQAVQKSQATLQLAGLTSLSQTLDDLERAEIDNQFRNLLNFWDPLSTNAANFFDDIGMWFSDVGQKAQTTFSNMQYGIQDFFDQGYKKALIQVRDLGVSVFKAPMKAWKFAVKVPFKLMGKAFKSLRKTKWKDVKNAFVGGLGKVGIDLGSFKAGFIAPFQVFNDLLESMGGLLASGLAPMISDIIGLLLQATPFILEVAGWLNEFWEILKVIFNGGEDGSKMLQDLFNTILSRLGEWINLGLQALTSAIPQLLLVIAEVIPMILTVITDNLPLIIDVVMNILVTLVQIILEMAPILIETVVMIIPMLITLIAEAIPVILNAIVQLIPMLLQMIADNIPLVIQAVISVVPPLIEAIVTALPLIIDAFIVAVPQIAHAILSQIPMILDMLWNDALPLLLRGVGDIIRMLFETIISSAVDWVRTLPDAISEGFSEITSDVVEGFKGWLNI